MTHRVWRTAAVYFITLGIAQPALADDDTEDIALLAALGLNAADGKATLGDKAGELEGYVLMASLLHKAGEKIRTAAQASGKVIVPLAGEQTFSLIDYNITKTRLDAIQQEMQATLPENSACAIAGDVPRGFVPDGTSIGIVDIVGALKTDTEISGYTVDPGTQMLINAIVAESDIWRIPSEIVAVSGKSELLSSYAQIIGRTAYFAGGACEKKFEAIGKALLDRARTLSTPSEKGAPSALEKAVLIEAFARDATDFRILRVDVEKAGGTLINRSNIWTTIGFNGVTMSGGLVVTYRLVDPVNGKIEKADTLVCYSPSQSLRAIARSSKPADGNCLSVKTNKLVPKSTTTS